MTQARRTKKLLFPCLVSVFLSVLALRFGISSGEGEGREGGGVFHQALGDQRPTKRNKNDIHLFPWLTFPISNVGNILLHKGFRVNAMLADRISKIIEGLSCALKGRCAVEFLVHKL